MTIPAWTQKSENMAVSSVGSVFRHSLSWNGIAITPAGTWGETMITLRSAGASSIVFLSLSDSVTVTVQASGNSITADVVCRLYHSINA